MPERADIPRAASCPICGRPVAEGFRPFCGRRCADVDLHRWLSGVYAVSAEAGEDAAPRWNFHKYLIDGRGGLVGAWPSRVSPTSPEIVQAIEAALAN